MTLQEVTLDRGKCFARKASSASVLTRECRILACSSGCRDARSSTCLASQVRC